MKAASSLSFSITSDYESIREKEVFEQLLTVLIAYAHKLIGCGTLRLEKNRDELAYDMAMETILKYLENPHNFDPTRNPNLVNYLKFNILKQLISNFKTSSGQKNEILYNDEQYEILNKHLFIENSDIYNALDLEITLSLIQKEICEDPILLELFDLRYLREYEPKEIHAVLNITKSEYSNRIRRLDTVRKRVMNMQLIESK